MNNYPKIRLVIDKSYDKNFFKIFADKPLALREGLRFLFLPKFKSSRQAIISAYVDNWYKLNADNFNSELVKIKKEWSKVESYFFKEVDKIFNNYPWPKGKYLGYGSIWYCFPRDIKRRNFAFPNTNYKKLIPSQAIKVIAHEMLHFIEYDYLQKVYHLRASEYKDKNNIFWQFTENLNVLIENSKAWKPLMGNRESQPYFDCKELYLKMKKIWDNNNDIDNLVTKIFKKDLK
jgi:hypothetical protein